MKPKTFMTDERTDEIVEAWRVYFDSERPGAKASVSEIIRVLIARAGMPPNRPMPRTKRA
jgi:hypothetical protein